MTSPPLADRPFRHPMTLGVRRPRQAAGGGGAGEHSKGSGLRSTNEGWREGLGLVGTEYEELPAERILDELRRGAAANRARRPWLVLGEPGAGKSTLLEAWFDAWAGQLPGPKLGLPVPVLVRLRELRHGDLDGDPEAIADRLWREHGARAGAARCAGYPAAEAVFHADRGRAVRPVWLFDGLDELDERLRGERPLERLVALPGAKLVTCRTAVFQAMRREAVDVHKEREFEVLPLKPAEQETFLTGTLAAAGRLPARAGMRHREIQANAALRLLAGNPLMLRLIAEVPDGRTLPATRAAFYREAVGAMWSRKLAPAEAARLREARDLALTEAARQMALEEIEAELSRLADACGAAAGDMAEELQAALERAGLVWVDPQREVFGFVHLTLQEFYLARALEPEGLRPVLERRWAEARQQETLALLISRLLAAGRAGEVDAALCWLVDRGVRMHRRAPRHLWRTGRSPLRVVLHLVRRAGAGWTELPLMARLVEMWLRDAPLGRPALAVDPGAPPDLLAALAGHAEPVALLADDAGPEDTISAMVRDWTGGVRGRVARNPSTPAKALAVLARDSNRSMRRNVAQNPAAQAEALDALARDADEEVRGGVAQNPSTPAELLAALARDADEQVRGGVARNPSTPTELLAALARDARKVVRGRVAQNPSTPTELLAALARDAQEVVRFWVAENPSTPAELLDALARDADVQVRSGVARNAAAPSELLAVLARDADGLVRGGIARNPSTPTELLATLTRDVGKHVRRGVAAKPLSEAFDRMLHDPAYWVSLAAAENPAAPAALLAVLARDADVLVRGHVALNPAAPTELLAALSCDADFSVRRAVARNPAAPAELLAALARDADEGVLGCVLENPSTILEDLLPVGLLNRMLATIKGFARWRGA
jgi:hypothetical protein